MVSNRIGSRINKLEELLKHDNSFDKNINSLALDIVLRTSETELLRTLVSDYQDESKDIALKEVESRIKYYKKLINKHIKQKTVRDVYLRKTRNWSISIQEYCDTLNVLETYKRWYIKNNILIIGQREKNLIKEGGFF